jgi:dihydroorotate dehydrogenase electron transfer subunit
VQPRRTASCSGEAPTPRRAIARVRELRGEGPANRRLTLGVDEWPGSEPGQFAMLTPGALAGVWRSDPLLPRPMAIYRERRSGNGAELEILFKVHGRGTQLLAEASAGDRIGIVGPLGCGFGAGAPGETAILVGGGTGVASLYGLARERAAGGRVHVLFGARRAQDLMGVADFEALPVEVAVATEDGSAGERGLVTALLERALAEPRLREAPLRVYACGPTPMMRRCAEICAERVIACSVSLEHPMACGFGVCLGCAAPRRDGGYALVCREGPVVDAAAIDWAGLP